MAKSSEYWKKRLENIATTQNKRADDYIEILELQYKKAMASIQRDLEAFYARYANAEGVDMATARKLLSKAEKEMWEVSLEEYRKMALDEEFIDQIESMYSKSRVSRLKALEMQIRAQLETLYSDLNTELGALLTDTFADTYYQTVYEIQKGTGIGTNFALFNEDAVKKIVSKPWKWGHFSSTVWNNKDLLLGELETALSQAFIRGDRIDKVIKTFYKKMGVGYSRAANIIQTEHAYIAGEATFKGYEETGVERYQYLATLDTRTSQICRDMDGKTFKLSEKVVWLNYPPLHCRCRSTTVPYFGDEESYGKRIARDHEGKVYYVPEDMKYHEWYDKYVKGNPDELLAEKKHKNRHADKKQYENYKKVLGKEVPRSLDEFQELKYTDNKKWELLKDFYKSRESNMISVFTSFEDYVVYKDRIEKELVGLSTKNGIQITGQSKHFLERVFGTTYDQKTGLPRSGVDLNEIKEAIINGNPRIRKNDPNSIKLVTDECMVSINPNTGMLIQVNPQ